jgi:CRP-like cAMP-binding protein
MAMSVRASAESLKQIGLFRECDSVPLQVMAFAARQEQFQPGEHIVDMAEVAEAAHFIVSGSADVHGPKGRIGVADPGSLIGEAAMIARTRYTVTAIANEQVVTAAIDYELFMRVTREYPEFGRAVLRALSDRLQASMRDFDQVRVMMNKVRSTK